MTDTSEAFLSRIVERLAGVPGVLARKSLDSGRLQFPVVTVPDANNLAIARPVEHEGHPTSENLITSIGDVCQMPY